jgi:decaprenylphospho-beta-D-erythro-pentofuranosid-2-ulose 2-reductase
MRDAFGGIDSVLLIGGTSDIGRAIVRGLSPRREVVLLGRDPTALARVADELAAELHVTVEVVPWDATWRADDSGIFDTVFGQRDIDVAVVAVGVLGDVDTHLTRPRTAVEMAEATYLGAMSALLHSARHLKSQGHGHLVVLSSFAVVRPRSSNFVYGSAKAGLDYLARGLADSLRGSQVRVTVLRVGFVRTRMTRHLPSAPFAISAEEVAARVVAAMSGGPTVDYAPRTLRAVAAAIRALPGPVFRRLRDR